MKFDPPRYSGPHRATISTGQRVHGNHRIFGIYSPDGRRIPDCDIRAGGLTTEPEQFLSSSGEPRKLDGPVLFAGFAPLQFGHVLTNSIGRLWALEHLPDETKLLYFPKLLKRRLAFRFLPTVLQFLGIESEIVISQESLAMEQVYTASDQFGERYDGRGSSEFLDWLDRRLGTYPKVQQGNRLYVSRSKLGATAGRFACEQHLEVLLQRQGYQIFSPEEHSLQQQFETMAAAENVIVAEGSALHFLSLFKRPEQKVAVIQRRRDLPALITGNMKLRGGGNTWEIDVIREVFWPPLRSDHLSVSLLDFLGLKYALSEIGMIDSKAEWSSPTREEERRSLEAGLAEGQHMLNAEQRQKFLRSRRRN